MKKRKRIQCPVCHGWGGSTEPVLDFGQGPWTDCGFCFGKGDLPRKEFFTLLGNLRHWKKQGEWEGVR